jgi:hypothetical protein
MSKAATRRHIKAAAGDLINKFAFAHGGKDDEVCYSLYHPRPLALPYQGHTNDFGHPAVRDLLHVFLFGHDNRIGNLRPAEFATRIPNGMLCLAVTAVSLLWLSELF